MTQTKLIDLTMSGDRSECWFVFQGPDGGQHRMLADVSCLEFLAATARQLWLSTEAAKIVPTVERGSMTYAPVHSTNEWDVGNAPMSQSPILIAFDPGAPKELMIGLSVASARDLSNRLIDECDLFEAEREAAAKHPKN